MNKLTKTHVIIFVLGFMLILFFIGLYVSRSGNSIDTVSEDAIALDTFLDQAQLKNSGEAVELFGSIESLDILSKDLYVFGSENYEKYIQQDNPIIGFLIGSAVKNGDTVSISGRYGATPNTVEISAVILNKNRIKTEIVDTATGVVFAEQLPSNSKENQFIGSLPLDKEGYTIDYDDVSSGYIVYVYNDPSNYSLALSDIQNGLGLESLETVKILQLGKVEQGIDNRF